MKKFMKGLLIGILAVVIGGVVLVVGCSALFDTAIQQEEQRANDLKNEVQEIVNNMEWRQKDNDWLVGEFTNTTDKKISYLEIQYKFMDNEGNVIDSNFTNETEISPGETREIQIDTCLANGYTQYKMIVNEANSYEE